MSMNRRELLKVSALATGGLMLQVTLPVSAEEGSALVSSKELNVYVQIDPDGEITIYSSTPEMGQGIKTTLPMIIAEEMGARWEDVTVIEAPLDSAKYGMQGAGGSTSVPRQYGTMRRMGASAREMLISAAALLMEVERDGLEARDSQVVHPSGESRTFGQLANLAAQQPVPDPEQLSYKDPRSYTIIGTSVSGVDNLVIATGQSEYGIDVELPDLHYATYVRCPRVGGTVKSFNEAAIKAMPGITHAFALAPNTDAGKAQMAFLDGLAQLRGGVAVVGQDTWSVLRARDSLQVEWDESTASTDAWADQVAWAKQAAAKGEGEVKLEGNDVAGALENADHKATNAFYEFPYVAHVCMEPMNCTAHYTAAQGDQPANLEVWAGSQFPGQIKEVGANLLKMPPDQITVHGLRMGGGFGRRAVHDFAAEAIAIAERTGVPTKLTWTRTDDIHNDFFRVGGFEAMAGAVDTQGKLAGWQQHYLGFQHKGKPVIGSGLRGYELPFVSMNNARVVQSFLEIDTPCGAWRAPGSNTNAFVEQGFIHELATLAGRDHVEFLLEILGEPRWTVEGNVNALNTGRAADCIKLVAEKAGWGRDLPAGRGLGLAFYFCHAAHVAEIAEVSVDANRNYTVHKVTAAIDVGPIINRSGALSQVQGSIVDGLSTMALQKITMANGVIEQDNFHQYPMMRLASTPDIDVHFIESDNPPTGLGEPALPPLAPAVTNAIFAANGERIRTMPLTAAGYTLV